ncbi:MAG TPA: TolC family protein [Gemmatimonadales bacterium]|nr:TolC family protein [Gemmatimonadales bacterium]
MLLRLTLWVSLACAPAFTVAVRLAAAQSQPTRVALILDRESSRFQPLLDATAREIHDFFQPGEIELLAPKAGDGTARTIGPLLDRTLHDSSVSIVVTLGPIGSHLLARGGPPPKPAIAGIIIDPLWQDIPLKEGQTGIRRLTYVDQSYPIGNTLADFHRLIPFRKLAIVLDRDLLQAIPQLRQGVARLVHDASGAEAVIIPAFDQSDQILAALPAGIDAVYLTPLPAMSEDETVRLIQQLNDRRLPTLSYLAEPEVRLGALGSYEPPENWQRRARRVAVDLQRILAGDDPGTLPVNLVSASRLTLNLTTARRIGFSPGWSVLTDAELVGVDSAGPADTLSLAETMRRAEAANLDLAAADLDVESGREDVHLARANLLPQVESRLTQTYTREGTAAASLGQQPQRQLDGGVSFSLPLYSEDAWAGFGSQRKLQVAREADRDRLRLDVVLDAAEAYLNVLRARTLADVQRSNLYRTRSNLEVARLREGVGSASRADIYRWRGEVATARKDLISAEAQVRVGELDLKRLLNRPLNRPLAQRPVSLPDPALLAQDSSVLSAFDHPDRFRMLTAALVEEALRVSPELIQADASLAAQRRQRTAAGRAFWLPTFSLQGGFSNVFDRSGAGSSVPAFPTPAPTTFPIAPDLTWQLRFEASLPIFTGFENTSTRAQSGIDLDRLEVQRNAVKLALDQRVRSALETAASSYAGIALTRDAAEAAAQNYALVSDAYASGSASITTVLDAQDAATQSAEAAANAVNDFLLDLMRVERAMGEFGALQAPEQRQEFLNRLREALEKRAP